LILTCFSLWINLGEKGMIWLKVQIFIGFLFLIYSGLIWRRFPQKLPKVIAYSFLMIFFLLSSITYHISLPHQGQQAKEVINQEEIDLPIGFYGNLHVGSKIRMSLGPRFHLVDLPRENWKEESENFDLLILEDRFFAEIDTTKFKLNLVSKNWESKAIPQLLLAYHSEEFDRLLEVNSKKYYLLHKK